MPTKRKKDNPPPFQFNFSGAAGPATWVQTTNPAYWNLPAGGLGYNPNSYFQNSMAPYNRQYPAGGLGLGLTDQPQNYSAEPSDRGSWYGSDPYRKQDWSNMLDNAWGYGLTYDQTQEGYTPGASERNSFGQPLGTLRPYNSAGMSHRRQNRFASQARPGAQIGDRWSSTPHKDDDGNWNRDREQWLRKYGPRIPKKGKTAGAGTTPAWVSGLSQLNVP